MSKIRTWTLGCALALLASTDWFVASAPADGGGNKASIAIGRVTATVAVRDAGEEGKERHAFLELAGEGRGTVKVRFQQEDEESMLSRMPGPPRIVWEREIPVDTATAVSVDLGALPAARGMGSRAIAASTDGENYVYLYSEGVALFPQQPQLSGAIKAGNRWDDGR